MFEMSRLGRRRRAGGLRDAMADYGMLAALILLVSLGSITVSRVNLDALHAGILRWIAAAH